MPTQLLDAFSATLSVYPALTDCEKQCFSRDAKIIKWEFFNKDFIYLFLGRRKEREREGEKYQCMAASHTHPTGDLAHKPGMCPDWESNRRPFGSQANTQSTEPHQSGLKLELSKIHLGCEKPELSILYPRIAFQQVIPQNHFYFAGWLSQWIKCLISKLNQCFLRDSKFY